MEGSQTTAPKDWPEGRGAAAPARETPDRKSVFDRAFLTLVRWDGEKLAWVILLAVALLSRTIGLGDRAMSHDESLHAVYSWKLYDGQGFQHQPMMHGPLKFVLNAFMYFLFGVNDWSARIQVALFGVLMVGLVWLMRRWLGKMGAYLAAVMFTISPALLYHSRYIRDEVILCALTGAAGDRPVPLPGDAGAAKWLIWTAVALGLALTTMEAGFILGGVFGLFLLLVLGSQLWLLPWPEGGGGSAYRVAVGVALPALLVGILFLAFKQEWGGLALAGLGALAAGVAVVLVGPGLAGAHTAFSRAGPGRPALHPCPAFPVGCGAEAAGLADQPV